MEKVKSGEKTSSSDNGHQLPEDFRDNVAVSLAQHILPKMGGVRVTKLDRFGDRLVLVALRVSYLKSHLKLDMEVEGTARKLRMLFGRAKTAMQHSLEFLGDAETIGKDLEDMKDPYGQKVMRPGWLNLKPARKSLERIKKRLGYWESTTAALIHPDLRTGDDESLAKQTPRKLRHPPFKPTPKSQELMHRAVEMLDDEIQNFTRGKVSPRHVNEFIAEFLESLGLGTVDVANVKTIRARYHKEKRSAYTADSSDAHQ